MKALSLLIKILILIAIIGVIVIVYTTCSGAPLVQRIDKTKPDTTYLREIATATHTYYAGQAVANDDGTVSMSSWYERMSGKWVYHEGGIKLIKDLRPRIVK